MTLSSRTLLLSLVGLALVGGLLFVTFRPDPVGVDLHVIDRGLVRVTVDADGKTRIKDVYDIAAPIAGIARRAPVAVGDPVRGGETVVAVVDPVAPGLLDSRSRIQAEATVRESQATLRVAETQLTQATEEEAYAQTQFDRTRTLVERGVSSLTALEDVTQRLAIATAARETAEAQIAQARGALERAQAVLLAPNGQGGAGTGVEMRAPADGVVLDIASISERPVAAGTPLLSIGDPGALEIVADLLSSDAVRLPAGARAIVERWGGAPDLDARLARIDPQAFTKVSALGIEEQRVDAVFDLLTPPAGRQGLGDGFSVFLRIVAWEDPDILRVPLSYVFRRGADWGVFVVQDGIARQRAVNLGQRDARFAVVLEGLEAGDVVVTHPSDAVADGVSVLDRATY